MWEMNDWLQSIAGWLVVGNIHLIIISFALSGVSVLNDTALPIAV